MEWYTKGVFFLQKWYVKGKEWDLEAGLPRIKLYWGPPGGVNLLNYCMTVCDSGHRKVFVFHINQVNLWALKYLNFLSVQTNHSFYTGVRIKRNGGVPPHLINNFFCWRAFSEGWWCSQFMVFIIWTVPIICFKNSTVFTIKVSNNLKFPGWRIKAEIESISHDTNSNN